MYMPHTAHILPDRWHDLKINLTSASAAVILYLIVVIG
jgi:hypothetical protein